jgi:hypothetical protein
MSTYEQFANKTLPTIIQVINAQSAAIKALNTTVNAHIVTISSLNKQVLFLTQSVVVISAVILITGIALVLKRYIKIERRKV